MTTVLVLPERLDLPAARPLVMDILDHAGGDLTLDAGGVEHLGGLGLQVLLGAARKWRTDGAVLRVNPRSQSFDAALAVFGLDDAIFDTGVRA